LCYLAANLPRSVLRYMKDATRLMEKNARFVGGDGYRADSYPYSLYESHLLHLHDRADSYAHPLYESHLLHLHDRADSYAHSLYESHLLHLHVDFLVFLVFLLLLLFLLAIFSRLGKQGQNFPMLFKGMGEGGNSVNSLQKAP
jgi:hypothetical protein